MTKAFFQGLTTGGRRMRDATDIRMTRGEFGYAEIDTLFSGPLDAPEIMPAGSTVNTTLKTWRGRPIIAQSEFRRD